MAFLDGMNEEAASSGSADQTDLDIELERRPDPIGSEYRHGLTRGKRQTCPISERETTCPSAPHERAGLFGLETVEIDHVDIGHPQRDPGEFEGARALDQFGHDFREVDARYDRFPDDPSDNFPAWLPVDEG
jgi:hypothetical protein